ncbi:hypothetical protein, partial [Mesonia phycicola]|uniref:hypothetical protein n=1 Tax=Mesonia phycicola TaxID=579105 RepID=UPI001F31EAE3
PADTDARASKLALFTIFIPNLPLAGKLYKTVVRKLKNEQVQEEKEDFRNLFSKFKVDKRKNEYQI